MAVHHKGIFLFPPLDTELSILSKKGGGKRPLILEYWGAKRGVFIRKFKITFYFHFDEIFMC